MLGIGGIAQGMLPKLVSRAIMCEAQLFVFIVKVDFLQAMQGLTFITELGAYYKSCLAMGHKTEWHFVYKLMIRICFYCVIALHPCCLSFTSVNLIAVYLK